MVAISKIELLYFLYIFGCKRQIVSLNPLIVFPVDNVMIPLEIEDFKLHFANLCKEWNYTEDFVYSKVKNAITLLVENGQFNFTIT